MGFSAVCGVECSAWELVKCVGFSVAWGMVLSVFSAIWGIVDSRV